MYHSKLLLFGLKLVHARLSSIYCCLEFQDSLESLRIKKQNIQHLKNFNQIDKSSNFDFDSLWLSLLVLKIDDELLSG